MNSCQCARSSSPTTLLPNSNVPKFIRLFNKPIVVQTRIEIDSESMSCLDTYKSVLSLKRMRCAMLKPSEK